MSLQVEKLENNMAKLTIEVPADDLEKALQSAYMKQKNKIAMPGFRKGKVPRQMIEKMYGPEIFYDDAANALIPKAYSEAYEECELEIVSRPEINVVQIEKGKSFIFTADVATKPEVKLGEYKGLEVDKVSTRVTQKEVDAKIQEEAGKNARTVTVEGRPVKDGDEVVLDFEGFVDGEAFEGGKGENYSLTIGSGTFIDGFEDQLIGKKPGETIQVKVTFPKDYTNADVAGKDAVFETKINYIEEEQKLTDQFVKENLADSYGVTSAKEMKKKIKDEIYKSNKTDYIWNHMIEKSTFKEIPDQLINDRIDVIVDGLKAELKSSNYSLKDYLSAYGIEDEDSLREQYKSSCESTVKVFLIADAIAAEKKITVTDDDIKEYFNGQDTAKYEKLYSKPYLNRVVLNDLVLKEIEKTTTVK